MAQPTTDQQQSVLTPSDRAQLFRLLGRMPYAGGITPRNWENLTVDELIATLGKLADRLTEHAEQCTARDGELERHRGLIRGGRRLLAELLAES